MVKVKTVSATSPRRSGRISATNIVKVSEGELEPSVEPPKKRRKRASIKNEEAVAAAVKVEAPTEAAVPSSAQSDAKIPKRSRKTKKEPIEDLAEDVKVKKRPRKSKKVEQDEDDSSAIPEVKAKRKIKETAANDPSNDEEDMHRFDGNDHWIGIHVSSAGGVEQAVLNARLHGCQSFALFLKQKMQWECPPLAEANVKLWKEWMGKYGYDSKRIMPHGSYLINLGNPDEEKRKRSLESFIDDLSRAARLGIGLYNFHPGSGVGECSKEEACTHVANCINTAHITLRQQGLEPPIILLENMATRGRQIGGLFQELGSIVQQVDDKTKVGMCLDTAHAFASGYDIRTKQGFYDMIAELEEHVGFQYLKGMHLNDSASGLASNRDRHANLGAGELGLTPFYYIVNDPRFRHMPLCLETPANSWKIWQGELQALYALQGLPEDPSSWTAVVEKLEGLKILKAKKKEEEEAAEAERAVKRKAKAANNRKVDKEDKDEEGEEDEAEDEDASPAAKKTPTKATKGRVGRQAKAR